MHLPEGWPPGIGLTVMESVDSTNAEAVRHAGRVAEPHWFIARHQTAGRGRRGRPWQSRAGNLAASLLMRPSEAPARAALRSFVMAVALREAALAFTGRDDALTLKWPNDVLLCGRKLAGILLESAGTGDRLTHLVIGVGVNLATHPDPDDMVDAALPATDLRSAGGQAVAPMDFLAELARAYARWEERFAAHGFAPVRREWLRHAARLGQEITARTERETVRGVFRTVDEDGALVLGLDARADRDEGSGGRLARERRVAAAEIHFPAPAAGQDEERMQKGADLNGPSEERGRDAAGD